jgi:hypothetical protein
VLDETAFTLCKENSIPVMVFDLREGNILRALQGSSSVGTIIDALPDQPSDIAPCSYQEAGQAVSEVAAQTDNDVLVQAVLGVRG